MTASDTTKGRQKRTGEAERVRDPETGDYASKLTPEALERIDNAIRVGSTLDAAARFGGITRDTFYRWLNAGRREGAEPLLAEFANRVDDAMAGWEVTANTLIATAANAGVWQAAAWSLERRKPNEYGRRMRLDGNGANPMHDALALELRKRNLDPTQLTPEEFDTLVSLMVKMSPGVNIPALEAEARREAIEA